MTKSHENHGKIVHRPCSSCISSIGNLMGTLSSSPCQLRLGVVLRCLSLSPYRRGADTEGCSPCCYCCWRDIGDGNGNGNGDSDVSS